MYNKNNWQYKGLVRWYRLDGMTDFIKDEITGRKLQYAASTDLGFKNTDSSFSFPLPNGLRGRPFFSYLNAVTQPGFAPDQHISINGITCSFWFIQKQAVSADYWLYYDYTGSVYPIAIRINTSNQFLIHNNTNFGTPATLSPTYSYNQWHHCVVTLTSTLVTLFIDGVKYTASTSATGFGSKTLVYSGFGYNTSATNTKVLLHDLRLYNYPWSDAQCIKFYSSRAERVALFNKPSIAKYTTFSLSSNTTPLYIFSSIPESSGTDIYVSGSPNFINDSTTLYTKNSENALNNTSLYVGGLDYSNNNATQYLYGYDTSNSGTNLYLRGKDTVSSGNTLYTNGTEADFGGINLVCQAAGNPISKGTNIFMWASTSGTYGIYNSTPMTVYNTVTTDPRNGINFSITAPNGDYSEGINLVVGNVENRLNLGTTLYIDGPEGIITSGLSMYINTPVGTTGTVPFDGGMNMFINRLVDSYATNTTLYLKAPEGDNSYTPMYINGANIITNNTSAYIEGSGVPTSNSSTTSFFTRGGE